MAKETNMSREMSMSNHGGGHLYTQTNEIGNAVIHYQGAPVKKLRNSWRTVALSANAAHKDGPHITRHTAATWQMHAGTNLYEAAGYLGMSPETLWETYGHHHPDFQSGAANAVSKKRRGPLVSGPQPGPRRSGENAK